MIETAEKLSSDIRNDDSTSRSAAPKLPRRGRRVEATAHKASKGTTRGGEHGLRRIRGRSSWQEKKSH
ncbi:hypothetical protein C7S16_5963 [Burkholderia thailandensis]|uniref:Uncharacterized protein n=1 Tax=Burkholderia thailandensis TaxID=57975 RepID=A0AAW9CSL8_BURTH|nr:hypothetical protein [Burkholderia thailandensis]MDW9251644.1 hypothetical protein [Burkholderia thailandensis]